MYYLHFVLLWIYSRSPAFNLIFTELRCPFLYFPAELFFHFLELFVVFIRIFSLMVSNLKLVLSLSKNLLLDDWNIEILDISSGIALTLCYEYIHIIHIKIASGIRSQVDFKIHTSPSRYANKKGLHFYNHVTYTSCPAFTSCNMIHLSHPKIVQFGPAELFRAVLSAPTAPWSLMKSSL